MDNHDQYNLPTNQIDPVIQQDWTSTDKVLKTDKDINIKDFYNFSDDEHVNKRGYKFGTGQFSTVVSGSTYTLSAREYQLGITNLSYAPNIGLPSPKMVGAGKTYMIKDEVGGAGTTTITIRSNGEETIDGSSTATITTNYGAKGFYNDGANWFTTPPGVASTFGKQNFTSGSTITAGQALHLDPYSQTDGGVTLDAHGVFAYNGTTNQTQNITVGNNSNRVLIVGVIDAGGAPTVTYDSVSMTSVDSQALASGWVLYLFKLVAPNTGTKTISVTGTLINNISYGSFYNVDQTTYVEASAKSGTSASLTTLTQGAYVYATSGESNTTTNTTSFPVYAGTKYQGVVGTTSFDSGSSLTTSFITSVAHDSAIASSLGLKVNETQTITYTPVPSGGSGTTANAVIVVSLKPVTAVSMGVVPTNASAVLNNEPLIDFVGFADSSVAVGSTVSVTFAGVVSGLSGLTSGKVYYLSNTPGAISTTRGTYGKVVGLALSSTTLLIAPNKTMGANISRIPAYTYTAECDGIVTGQTSGTGSTVSITANGNLSPQVGATASFSTPGTTTALRGGTYSFTVTGTSQNLNFIPIA